MISNNMKKGSVKQINEKINNGDLIKMETLNKILSNVQNCTKKIND